MAIDNRKQENLPLASTSMPQRSEVEFSLMNTNSAYCNAISGDYDLNEVPNPCPMISVPPPPNLNMLGTSQCYNQEIVLAAGNSMVDSSQSNSPQNCHINQHDISEKDSKPHLFRPDSDLPCPVGYIGQPSQYTRNNLIIPNNIMDASKLTNSFEKLHTGRNFVTARNNSAASAGGLQMVNLSGWPTNGNTSWPLPDMNFGMPPFSPYQGGVVPSNYPENFDERYVTFGGESNTEAKSSTNISRIKVAGSSGREYFPPTNTFHNQMGSRSFLDSGFDMTSAFSGFQNNNEVASNLTQNVDVRRQPANDQKVMFDARPVLSLGPSYALQRPPESCMDFWSLSFGGSQPMFHDIGQSNASGQPVPLSSTGTTFNQPSPEQLPKYNMASGGQFSSHSYHSSPLVVAAPESYPSSLGMQTGSRNMTAQGEGPSVSSSLKRVASQSQQASSIQVQRRKTFTARPFMHPSTPSLTTSSSVSNNAQTIQPLTQSAPLLTPQVTNQFTHPSIHNFAKCARSVPNITQTIPPLTHRAPSLTPLVRASASLPLHDKITQSFLPSSLTPSVQHQPQTSHQSLTPSVQHRPWISHPSLTPSVQHQPQTSHPMPRPQWRAPVIPITPMNAPVHIKYKEETPEPLGHKCLICRRDISFTPEGHMFQPTIPPAAAVLPCGHTFHDSCLQRITPDDLSKDPPCIPCALGE